MKSREAIRNQIINYTNRIWGIKNPNTINPLFQLIIEEICNELYLLDNKLNDIDATILEKLVETLSPSLYNYVRPAHGILQAKPDVPTYHLNRNIEFSLKELQSKAKDDERNPPVFTSLTDFILYKMSIKHIFFNQSLWSVDEQGKKTLMAVTEKKAAYNTVWLQIEADADIKQWNNLFFYIDFPHLNDNHDYYGLLPTARWVMAGKQLSITSGLPLMDDMICSNMEKDILHFYEGHYQTITNTIRPDDLSLKKMPSELSDIIPDDILSSLPEKNWLSITFPPHFETSDLEKMKIVLNAFPVINRRYNEYRQAVQNLSTTFTLPSEPGEEFLDIESFADTAGNPFAGHDTIMKQRGSYTLTPVRKKKVDDTRIYDRLEHFADLIQNNKTAFPNIDEEKIQDVLNLLSDIQDKDNKRLDLNKMNEYADVAKVSVHVYEDTATLDISYWTTLAGQMNGLEEGATLMATTIPELNKNKAVFLTPVTGGRIFYDVESLKAINRFFLTSKGRILTKHDILSYCRLEIGKYAESIDVIKSVKISPRFKEGLINIMEIRIKPKEKYQDYLNKKEAVKELRTRLAKRSPGHFNYEIVIENNK